jgi:uncharacterized MAPEG superfamily protein
MIFPVWMLLGFAAWTIVLLLCTVGVYRWSRILTGKVEIGEFRGDRVEGSDWYLRAMRAHANCVENLPVFGAIVLVIYASGFSSNIINILSAAILVARILQSVVHVAMRQTNSVVTVRFVLFFIQILSFMVLAITLAYQLL